MIFIISMFLMTSCQNNEINQINYYQEYTSAYVRYKIDSEKEGYQYVKSKELDVDLFNESKEFFLDLINANFEIVDGPTDGSPRTYTYNLILQYGKKSDYIKMSKNNLNPSTNVWFCDEKGRDIYPTNRYMTYEYYKRMFNLIDKYDILLSDVEWEEIEFHC